MTAKRADIRVKAKEFIKTNLEHYSPIRKAEVEDMLTDFGEKLTTNDGSVLAEKETLLLHVTQELSEKEKEIEELREMVKGDGFLQEQHNTITRQKEKIKELEEEIEAMRPYIRMS